MQTFQISTNKAMSPEADCWTFVYNDLKFAVENLQVSKSPIGRLTSGAAYALMSRAMLYCQNWKAVKEACEKIFAMGYSLTIIMPMRSLAETVKISSSILTVRAMMSLI